MPLLTIRQAATRTGLTVHAIEQALVTGALACYRLGSARGKRWVQESDVEVWVSSHRVEPRPAPNVALAGLIDPRFAGEL